MRDIETEPTIISVQAAQQHGGTAPTAQSVARLGLTVSNPPTQAEVQAISDKLDELLATLHNTT